MEKEDVLQLALSGDIRAFQTLFAEFQNQLKSYLYRLLPDRDDVEDLTHDTFIKAFANLSTFHQDSSLKTWVFKIATNLAYDHLRKQKRWQPDAQDRAGEQGAPATDGASQERPGEDAWAVVHVHERSRRRTDTRVIVATPALH